MCDGFSVMLNIVSKCVTAIRMERAPTERPPEWLRGLDSLDEPAHFPPELKRPQTTQQQR
jgi:hypothetical protein